MTIRLLNGDCRELLKICPDARFDAVITDLPYIRPCLPLWGDVSLVAGRVLKPGAPFLTYTGAKYLPEILQLLGRGLSYQWLGKVIHSGSYFRAREHVRTCGKPYALFYRPPYRPTVLPFVDILQGGGKSKKWFEWEQPIEEAQAFIRMLTRPGDWILDPCCGSGTTLIAAHLEGRNAIGIEIDRPRCALVWERLREERVPVECPELSRTSVPSSPAPRIDRYPGPRAWRRPQGPARHAE